MNIKRLLIALIGLPLVALVFVLGNKYIIDVLMAIIAGVSIYEYFKCCSKEVKGISWIGYVLAAGIAFLHIIKIQVMLIGIIIIIPTILLLLFMHIIVTNMKITLKDVAFSFLGICYIIFFTAFIPLIYGLGNSYEVNLFYSNSSVFDTFKNSTLNGNLDYFMI